MMFEVPPALRNQLGLKAGMKFDLHVIDKANARCMMTSQVSRMYALDELLAQYQPSEERDPQEAEWLSGGPVGKELL